MRVVASDPALDLIEQRGGSLYLWLQRDRCCGSGLRLISASQPPARKEFRRVTSCERFNLYLPVALAPLPEELHIEARRFPRRLEAYWNGCAWVT